jgi:hypothetical protein
LEDTNEIWSKIQKEKEKVRKEEKKIYDTAGKIIGKEERSQ